MDKALGITALFVGAILIYTGFMDIDIWTNAKSVLTSSPNHPTVPVATSAKQKAKAKA